MQNKKITQNNKEFGEFIAKKIVGYAQKTLEVSTKFFIAVSGGTTPVPVFKKLGSKSFLKVLDWSKVHVFFIDERCVALESEDNNFQNCYNYWLSKVKSINHHRIHGWVSPNLAAKKYENKIVETLPFRNSLPCFDLIFMGIGNDGHIASLFPNYDFEEEENSLVKHVNVDSEIQSRITMTIPLLNNAKNRIIGIRGKSKKKIYSDVMVSNNKNYPVSQLLSSNANDLWVLQ